ncbi:MAG: TlpA family protein disulfide reductase [Alphaproteobacteria bacterium]|nr:TlpA family protein disulfide reductase [Alphaproteobacteria bacterium]
MWGAYARFAGELVGDDGAQPPRQGAMKEFILPAKPEPVPALTFLDRDQKERTLAEFQGKVVLLNLWATWCEPCIREMPSLERLQATLAGRDFTVLALSQDRGGLPLVEKFYQQHGLKLDMYVDKSTTAARALKARGLPTTFLIDAEGRELGRFEGAADWDAPEAVALLRHFLPKPALPATRATDAGAK